MTFAGSLAPNTELPATIQFAPAEAAKSMVEGPKPPSTYIKTINYQFVRLKNEVRKQN